MNFNYKLLISLILGFITSLAIGFYLGGTHPLMLEIDRLATKAFLPSIGLIITFSAFLIALFSFKLAYTINSPTLKKILNKLAAVTFFLMMNSIGFTLGIIGLANRI